MFALRLIVRNAWRHPLRTGLTVLGMVVAVLSFGLLRTVVDAWYAGADQAAPNRVVTRNAVSLVFPLPLAYRERVRAVEGVQAVSWANWFGGVYKEPKNFFAQFAVDVPSYFAMYREYLFDPEEFADFRRDRRGCVVGSRLAQRYGFRVGDNLTLRGTIYPGDWTFVIRGIYHGRDKATDEAVLFFHWDFLNETLKQRTGRETNNVGVFIAEASDADRVTQVALDIDAQFRNSRAETLTETEKAFQLGFVAMSEAIITAIRVVAMVVIVIILAVLANTMVMTARERTTEYATLKALGFTPNWLGGLILGESLFIALLGAGLGVALTFPVAHAFATAMGTFFPVFNVAERTLWLQLGCGLSVGLLAGLWPARQAMRVRIVEGLRALA